VYFIENEPECSGICIAFVRILKISVRKLSPKVISIINCVGNVCGYLNLNAMKILFNCLVIILKSVSFTMHIEQENETFNNRRKHISIYLDSNFDANHIYCNSSGSSIKFSLAPYNRPENNQREWQISPIKYSIIKN